MLGTDAWLATLRTVLDYVYLPHAMLLLVGLSVGVVLAVVAVLRRGVPQAVGTLFRSPALPLLICLGEAVVALTSSQNKGSAFIAPVMPVAIVLAVWGIHAVMPWQRGRTIAAMAGVALCLTAAVPLADASWDLARPWAVWLPGLTWTPVTDGRGTIQLYERYSGGFAASPNQPLAIADGEAWLALIDATSRTLQAAAPSRGVVAFGFRHALYNINTIRLSALLQGEGLPPLVQVEPVVSGDSVAGYAAWLANREAAGACLLVTLTGDEGQFLPKVSKDLMLRAAQAAGFVVAGSWTTPSGQKAELWKRMADTLPCT